MCLSIVNTLFSFLHSPKKTNKKKTPSHPPTGVIAAATETAPHPPGRLVRVMKHPLTSCRSMLGDRNVAVDLLAILFGIGSWIGVNAVYLQLPLFVAHAPEGWTLPSFLVIVTQCGNIGPLLYTLTQRWSPCRLNDTYLIWGIYALGVTAAIGMATMYRLTAVVAGEPHSVALLAVTFLFAFIGCTSSVLFMPYMGRFREMYLITYLVGEGLSGFLPSVLALAQGVGGNTVCVPAANRTGETSLEVQLEQYTPPPRFESDAFFYCIFALMVASFVAFVLLDRLQMCRREYASVTIRHGNDYRYGADGADEEEDEEHERPVAKGEPATATAKATAAAAVNKRLSARNYVFLLFVMAAVSSLGSGIYPSLQSYSCLPYGNLAYHLTVTLGSIANPLACFMAVFLPHQSIRHIVALCGVLALLTVYAFATAVMSPQPPLLETVVGEILVVS